MITAGKGTLFHEKRLMVFSLQSKVSNLADHTRVSGPIRQLKSYSFSKKRSKSIKLKRLMFVKDLTALFETQVSFKPTDCREVRQLRGSPQNGVFPRAHTASI